jgi:hypothetical protein
MTQNTEQDLALVALLAAARELDAGLPDELLRKSYLIQRSHQFDREENRETSLQDLTKLVEDHLDSGGRK